ncbi:MAG: hypothetical protein ACTMKZ_07665 [Brevibacterium aurantiacum]|uniref:Uncharacterized protein n=1 Tax=Brevibacterium aurantiacum TaxID=273384 RepID=A0A1D7W8K4_BREAU|nr:hypothetical protein [Brevibacterium aurantiacum]AOP55340.1 hypothetical protein BLSMQ_3642 [Brevibacterium aurantiacum]AZL07217.1 hypothetical protein CXR24_17785 [Brevibacterium aurantiacum]AZL10824.1 hypothetical protein CXR26_17565 [Brevibacterium aurantiacum]AZL14434.1 hypothetical protein CXR25_17570 [Brevibacterium aurantiacum]AZT95013.1 hypothetical protein CXR23_19230 [Brevibacterium aurantiacum]
MLSRWKVAVITGLFAFGALSFVLGLFPLLADIFWILWFAGCGACILALVLTVIVPSPRSAANRYTPRSSAADSADGVSQP